MLSGRVPSYWPGGGQTPSLTSVRQSTLVGPSRYKHVCQSKAFRVVLQTSTIIPTYLYTTSVASKARKPISTPYFVQFNLPDPSVVTYDPRCSMHHFLRRFTTTAGGKHYLLFDDTQCLAASPAAFFPRLVYRTATNKPLRA